mmetsp:Transcript_64746/g.156182  ORF Transcript_64746/g.156182 Transcript_64746/m.156182 type:complete len:527 (-) Transcript_64746:220-1800(-)
MLVVAGRSKPRVADRVPGFLLVREACRAVVVGLIVAVAALVLLCLERREFLEDAVGVVRLRLSTSTGRHLAEWHLPEREHGVREKHAEARVLQRGVVRMEVDERLEHVDLPEAKALGKVAVGPILGGPHVSHGDFALAQVVVHVNQVEEAMVERVHHRCFHAQHELLHLAEGDIPPRPGLLVVLVRGEVRRRCDHHHGLLRVVTCGEHGALLVADHVVARETIVIATHLLRAQLLLLIVLEQFEELILGVVLVGGLHHHHGEEADPKERQDARHRAKPAVGDEDTARADPRLHHPQRERDALPRPLVTQLCLGALAVLLSLHSSLALVDLKPKQNATKPAAERVQLEALGRGLAEHPHEPGHATSEPLDHALVQAKYPTAFHRRVEGVTQRVPKFASLVEWITRHAVRWQLKARLHLLEPFDAALTSVRVADFQPFFHIVMRPKAGLGVIEVGIATSVLWEGQDVHPHANPLEHVGDSHHPVAIAADSGRVLPLSIRLYFRGEQAEVGHGQKVLGVIKNALLGVVL